jgi:hypothetical protein
MISKSKIRAISIVLAILMLSNLACSLGGLLSRQLNQNGETRSAVPVLPAAQQNTPAPRIPTLAAPKNSQPVKIDLTEAQINEMIAAQLAENPDIPVQNAVVALTPGQMQIEGTVQQNGLSLAARVILTVSVDAAGLPKVEFISAKIGPLPVPNSLLDQLSTRIAAAIQTQVQAQGQNIVLQNITIGNQTISITGYAK